MTSFPLGQYGLFGLRIESGAQNLKKKIGRSPRRKVRGNSSLDDEGKKSLIRPVVCFPKFHHCMLQYCMEGV